MRFPIPAVLLAACVVITIPARAVDIGECGTPEAMTAKFKAEDQHSIASADLVTNDKRLLAMIFTMNPDRSVGYIVQADQPTGERASKICVYNRMASIRLFDARKPGVPVEVLLKAPEADALRRCDELASTGKFPKGTCNSLNAMIRRSERNGERVMIQAFTVERQPDGSYKPDGALVTISGNVGGSIYDDPDHPARGIVGDIVYSSLPDGASILNAALVYPKFTEYGLAALK